MDYQNLLKIYRDRYQTEARVFRSPGRINIIGEHTDYNEGLVFPAGIDKEICMVMGSNGTDRSHIYSVDNDEEISFSKFDYLQTPKTWIRYIAGVYDQLYELGLEPGGVDCVFAGDIPVGAGLSSSAALECATLFGLNELFELKVEKAQIPVLSQKAENDFVGVNCGIMDQFASVYAQKNQALLLDCRDLTATHFDLNLDGYHLILVDSLVKHDLVTSEYNLRRRQCEEGLAFFQQVRPEIKALRDLNMADLENHGHGLSPLLFKRCKYIVQEIERVRLAGEAIKRQDLAALGNLLYASHLGMQSEFEISCIELDFLVDYTWNKCHVLGARMMGGGFGGCTLNIVASEELEKFSEEVKDAYEKKFGIAPKVYTVATAKGTSEIQIESN